MNDPCRDRVANVLADRRSPTKPGGLTSADVTARLVEMAPECSHELVSAARRELTRFERMDEGSLNVLLDAIVRIESPDAKQLLREALRSPGTLLKEDYLAMLEDLDARDDGLRDLVEVLRAGLHTDREDVAVCIRALHAARYSAAAEDVAAYVRDLDRTVRGLAVAFLYDLDDAGLVGAPALLKSLEYETDPDIVEQAVAGVDRWDHAAAVPRLKEIAEEALWPGTLKREASEVAARLQSL